MKSAYRVLAFLIALEVVIQAAAMVYAVAGLGIWIKTENGVFDQAALESEELLFPEMVGIIVHGVNGMMLMPALALIFLVLSFFAKVPGGVKWAAFVLLAVVVQVALGVFGHENAIYGALHGINAMLLFGLAVTAGMRVRQEGPAAALPRQRRRSTTASMPAEHERA